MSETYERLRAAIERDDKAEALACAARLDAKYELEQAKRHAREQYWATEQARGAL